MTYYVYRLYTNSLFLICSILRVEMYNFSSLKSYSTVSNQFTPLMLKVEYSKSIHSHSSISLHQIISNMLLISSLKYKPESLALRYSEESIFVVPISALNKEKAK